MKDSKHCTLIGRRLFMLAVLVLPGCVNLTVNVYFPEPEIREAAEAIESEIRGTQVESGNEISSAWEIPLPGGAVLAFAFNEKQAYAQEESTIDIDIDTPALKKLRERRKARYKQLEPHMASGRFGEGLEGYLVLRDTENLAIRDLQQLKKLLSDENKDREAMYREILEAHKLPEQQLKKIQEIFAKAIRKTMKPGNYYQVNEKTWAKKEKPKDEKEQQ